MAKREAVAIEKVTDGLALHSDQGSQYTSKEYFDLTQLYNITPSMSSPGCPCFGAFFLCSCKIFFEYLKKKLPQMLFIAFETAPFAMLLYKIIAS
ncbi:MAG: hypothetical protein E7647_08510 [Ruminococcaceae bacterium]|nr:hypothetical protein [Oscillospiraceae bacterium]